MTTPSSPQPRHASWRFWLPFAARMALALIGVALAWVLLARGQDPSWQRLQRGEPLRVAMDPSFPPFESVDARGELVGFDVDLARELGRRLSVPVTFLVVGFDGLADAVMAGKGDAVISAFPLDPRLSEDVHNSQPYFEAGLVMVTRAETFLTAEQLPGVQVAVEWGGQGDAWARGHGLSRVLRAETAQQALDAVHTGQADAALVDAVTAALDPQPGLHILTPPLVSDPYVILLPKRTFKLNQAVDDALRAIMTDGTWDTLARRYFPHPPPKPYINPRPGKPWTRR